MTCGSSAQREKTYADGEIGEMLVRGPSSAAGYWNQRERTRRVFEGEWTRTGDKYVRRSDGAYSYCGRTDDMFKVSGIWVSPFEVEAALASHPQVLEAAVVPAKDDKGLVKPWAFVVLKNGGEDGAGRALYEGLKTHVKRTVGPWKYPRWIEFVDALPKTSTGKIQRFKLRERAALAHPTDGCQAAMIDLSHLAWPFFDELASRVRRDARSMGMQKPREAVRSLRCGPNMPIACSSIGAGRMAERRSCPPVTAVRRRELIVRTLCLAREILAWHDRLADFAFAMQGLGSGIDIAVRQRCAESKISAGVCAGQPYRRLRAARTGCRLRRQRPCHDGVATAPAMCASTVSRHGFPTAASPITT